MRVRWTREARERLKKIEAYIAKDDPESARKLARRLVLRTRDLADLPHIGRQVPEYVGTELREVLERPFRLIYRIREDQVEIMTVMHYRQLLPDDWRELLGQGRMR